MKRFIFQVTMVTVLSTLVVNITKAQQSAQSSPFNLSIVLQDAIAINLGGSPDVLFTYATATDYANSKTVAKAAHFSVISNRNYDISLAANAAFNVNNNNATPVPLSVVNISVNRTGMSGSVGGTDVTATLSQSSQSLVTNANASIGSVYNINFVIPTAANLVGKAADTYTTTVTYTATQL
jgi:hypothetical protein